MLDSEKIKLVQDFIFNDEVQDILSKINDSVMDFNILEITGMGTQEIKHSNILGWLFGDNEHNLEYEILDNFLKKVIQINDNYNLKSLQEYLYLSDKKRDIAIYREKDNIDLLIVDELNKIVIAIENKVYASERVDGEDGGQLQKYEEIIYKQYKDYKKYFIFLTINLEKPSKENWLKANYQIIVDVIENILKTKEIDIKTKIILESYIDLLKRNGIVENKKLKELCEKIWKNHKEALLILNQYQPGVRDLLNSLKKHLQNLGIGIIAYNSTETDFQVVTQNYKNIKNYKKLGDYKKADIRYGFYIVKSSQEFWLRLADTPSKQSLQYFQKIKNKLIEQNLISPRVQKRIDIYTEDIFGFEVSNDEIINKFINILKSVDECFK